MAKKKTKRTTRPIISGYLERVSAQADYSGGLLRDYSGSALDIALSA